MKLRNKKTGEIKPAEAREDGIYLYDVLTEQWYKYELDLLAKWWEYYEELKEYWYIDPMVCGVYCTKIKKDEDLYDFNKQIGNYFETKEEAEKAVEKLKAWKRLKGKGFRFNNCKIEMSEIVVPEVTITAFIDTEEPETLNLVNLLFGGKK